MYLMCPPTHFSVDYSINPWMKGETVNAGVAQKQWNFLKVFLAGLGAEVKIIEPNPNYPDMVFTANAGIVHKKKVILSNFKHEQRRGEKEYFRKWFIENNYEIYELPDDLIFEGRGDCFVYRDFLVGGYGQRSEKDAIINAAEILGLSPVPIKLTNPNFYHLDTCMSILSSMKGLSIYVPSAFDESFEKTMDSIDMNLIPVTQKEAEKFACNSIVYQDAVIMPSGNEKISAEIERHGFVVAPFPMGEFLKSGGACRCLVLEI